MKVFVLFYLKEGAIIQGPALEMADRQINSSCMGDGKRKAGAVNSILFLNRTHS